VPPTTAAPTTQAPLPPDPETGGEGSEWF
jgi:hypothetical protein